MNLELTKDQHELVLHILQSRLGELRQEIRHSSVSTFTKQLKEMEILLKSVIHEIEFAQSAESSR